MTREFMTCRDGKWTDGGFCPCDAPAEARTFGYHHGVDTDGEDAVFELLTIECVAGHRYNEIGEVVK